MNRELIIAALDGKTIQWKQKAEEGWKSWERAEEAVGWLAIQCEKSTWETRIKPSPPPDRMYFDVVRRQDSLRLADLKLHYPRALAFIKVTIKTDENGKETKHVEIVE